MRPRTDVTSETPTDLAGQADTPLATAHPRAPRRRLRALTVRVAAGLGILAVWQICVSAFAPSYIATPVETAKRIPTVLGDGQFASDVQTTLTAIVEGLLIAIVIGTVLGLAMGRLPDVNRVLGMYVGAFYAAPLIAVVPLLTVWFGYTSRARLVVIVLEAMLPIIYNVAEGARLVPSTFLDVTRIHRTPWWRVWGGVVLPNAVPYALAGLDLAIGRALIGAIVAEFVTAINGLGYYILFNVRSFHENEAMVALLVLVVFALIIRALVNLAVTRGLPWYRPAQQSEGIA